MIIGFTGHQRIASPQNWGWIREQMEQVLQANAECSVLVCLAEGADQLFASSALELGVPVEAVIPCQDYASTFSNPTAKSRYEDLLRLVTRNDTLALHPPSEEAFLVAGRHIVDRSDLLVAVWNGKPAAGKGGTGDIVAYARSAGRPVLHIHPELLSVSRVQA